MTSDCLKTEYLITVFPMSLSGEGEARLMNGTDGPDKGFDEADHYDIEVWKLSWDGAEEALIEETKGLSLKDAERYVTLNLIKLGHTQVRWVL